MILFKPHHKPMILNGTKTETRRNWKRQRARVGSVHKAKTVMLSEKFFAKLKILAIFKQRLGDMTEADARAEGGYTLKEYKKEFFRINGFWADHAEVFVVKFKLWE